MDAAVAALIGAGVGAVVPSAAALMSSRSARQDAREGRLFDHRREAYAQFLSQARSSLSASAEWYMQDIGDPPEDALAPLYQARAEVSLYGTAESDGLALAVFRAVSTYTFGSDRTADYNAADAAIDLFVEQARADLGVPSK